MEATKFTEVGYHGRDVDQIIRDLVDVSMTLTKRLWTEKLRNEAAVVVEDRILDLLTGPSNDSQRGRESFRDMLKQGILDDQEIEVDVPSGDKNGDMNFDGNNPNLVAMSEIWQRMSSGQKKQAIERKKLPISEARKVILEVELEKMLENVDLKKEAITAVEESGIVFIDEMYVLHVDAPADASAFFKTFFNNLFFCFVAVTRFARHENPLVVAVPTLLPREFSVTCSL